MIQQQSTISSSLSSKTFTVFLVLMSLAASSQTLAAHIKEQAVQQFLQQLQGCSKYQSLGISMVSKEGQFEYGIENRRLLKQDAPPRAHADKYTVFCLGGATQAFTSVLLSMLLASNGKYTMDTPLHEITGSDYHLPGQFRTRRVNLKDILTMRTGLSNMDIVATAMGMNRYRLMQNLRFAPEISPFREENVYSEVLYSLAEDAARALGGDTWYNLLRQHIFTPLGMTNAGFVHTDAQTNPRVALPYLMFRDNSHQVPWEAFKGQEIVAAATSVCASASDMTKWLHFITTAGKNKDKRQIVKEETIRSTFQSVQYRREGSNPRLSGFRSPDVDLSYTRDSNALGWIKGTFDGQTFVSQEGSLPGYESLVTILPSGQGGVFVAFTGVAGSKAFALKTLINMFALEMVLKGSSDLDACNTLKRMTKATEDADSMSGSQYPRPAYARNEDALIRPAEEYEGTYRNYAFGDVVIRRNDTGAGRLRLELQYGELGSYVLHQSVQNDTFIMQAKGPLTYSTDMDDYRLQGPYLAVFSSRYNDSSRRIEAVTIPHFARDTDPVFSKNPTPPRMDYGDRQCYTASAATKTTAATLVILSFTFACSFLC